MKDLRIAFGLAALIAFASPTLSARHVARQSSNGTTVNLGYASYEGTIDSTTNVTKFLGIRYAAAPVGEFPDPQTSVNLTINAGKLRFQRPQAPPTVSGVQLANVHPQQCPQGDTGTSATSPFVGLHKRQAANASEIEDCLFLKFVASSYSRASF